MHNNKTTKIYELVGSSTAFGRCALLGQDGALELDCGEKLNDYSICYNTYGDLNQDRSNAILVCHALTGDHFVASTNPITQEKGWWRHVVGKGLPIDTEKYFVVCSNVIGGCMGSSSPASIEISTKEPYGLRFPIITIRDMVRAQRSLMDYLRIDRWLAVVGGSMGGMQALQWVCSYPEKVNASALIATAPRLTAQNLALNAISRNAIMSDPNWEDGDYQLKGCFPTNGLQLARRMAFISYLSEEKIDLKFGRKLQTSSKISCSMAVDFKIESYLRVQGEKFVERFDPNSYLYITRAMDYFDIAHDNGGGFLRDAFKPPIPKLWISSFTSDWLFPPSESEYILNACVEAGAKVGYSLYESINGHDAFLLPTEKHFLKDLGDFLSNLN